MVPSDPENLVPRRANCTYDTSLHNIDTTATEREALVRSYREAMGKRADSALTVRIDDHEFTYVTFDDNTCGIIRCETSAREVRIPDSIEGLPVVALAQMSFSQLNSVESIVCSADIFVFGNRTFNKCTALKRLELPAKLNDFDDKWLLDCRNLEDIVLPEALQEIKLGMFESCRPKRIFAGSQLREVNPDTFKNSSLEQISISPENENFTTDGLGIYSKNHMRFIALAARVSDYVVSEVTEAIGQRAFAYRSFLDSVTLPESVTEIEPFAFMTSQLRIINMPRNLREIGDKAFYRCTKLNSIEFGDQLETIGADAFAYTALEHADLPKTVASVGYKAFSFTPMIKKEPCGLCVSDENPFLLIDGGKALYRKNGSIGSNGFTLLEMLATDTTEYDILPGTTAIDSYAFRTCVGIERIGLPEGLERIGHNAFHKCKKITRLKLPSSIRVIEYDAFRECRIETLRLPAGIEVIGECAFKTTPDGGVEKPASLTSITLEEGCENFFIKSGLLCRWMPNGKARVVAYAGPDINIVIPRCVDSFDSYALAGICGIKSLFIHKDIDFYSTQCLKLGTPLGHLTLELSEDEYSRSDAEKFVPNLFGTKEFHSFDEPKPYIPGSDYNKYGRSRVEFEYTPDVYGIKAFGEPLRHAHPTLEDFYAAYDQSLLTITDNYEYGRRLINRLFDPILLDPLMATWLRSSIDTNFINIGVGFAEHNYMEGFDQMCDLGILTPDRIQEIIEALPGTGNAEASSYLLDLSRRKFSSRSIDFSL